MSLPNALYYRNWYIFISILTPLVCALSRSIFMRIMVSTNEELHDSMSRGIMRAPISFFENNSPGTIMNRFSKELGQVDDLLSGFEYFLFIRKIVRTTGGDYNT